MVILYDDLDVAVSKPPWKNVTNVFFFCFLDCLLFLVVIFGRNLLIFVPLFSAFHLSEGYSALGYIFNEYAFFLI